MTKAAEAFRTISEVADELEIPKHVLRFWEVKFPQIRPMKRVGGRRYYRPQDMELLRGIQKLLHAEGYTIKGVQKILREQGVDSVKRPAAGEGAVIPPRKTVSGSQLGQPLFDAGRPMAASRRGRAKSGGKTAEQTRTALIEAAIAELRLCRNILVAAPMPSASPARKPRQA